MIEKRKKEKIKINGGKKRRKKVGENLVHKS